MNSKYIFERTLFQGNIDIWFSFFIVVIFCEVTAITELTNTEPLLIEKLQG